MGMVNTHSHHLRVQHVGVVYEYKQRVSRLLWTKTSEGPKTTYVLVPDAVSHACINVSPKVHASIA